MKSRLRHARGLRAPIVRHGASANENEYASSQSRPPRSLVAPLARLDAQLFTLTQGADDRVDGAESVRSVPRRPARKCPTG